ncbi:MAG TPA: response regulator transcription factor [Candidatus Eisenbacteria bacterium]|nr:response regulator transcription factor [Candidatus Eisenbacteria bacterium]
MARSTKKTAKKTARKSPARKAKKPIAAKASRGRKATPVKAVRKPAARAKSAAKPATPRTGGGTSAVIRIVVADKLPLDRRSLVSLLATQPDFEVVGEAETATQAGELCAKLKPGILLIALRIGANSGRTPIVDIRAAAPLTPILAMAERGEGECIVLNPPKPGRDIALGGGAPVQPICSQGTDCLQIAVAEGASGTIRRSAEPEVFFHAIRTVSSGNAWYEAGTASAIMRHALSPHQEAQSHALSSRELDVAELISIGRSNKEIAQALGISEPTVKKHVGHILDKLGLQDRLQVGLFVARNPLVLQPNGARRR